MAEAECKPCVEPVTHSCKACMAEGREKCPHCGKGPGEATMSCPTCLKLGIESMFCCQTCFKEGFPVHKLEHKKIKDEKDAQNASSQHLKRFNNYSFSGPLRPGDVTPQRRIKAGIKKPDYADTGLPNGEFKTRNSNTVHIHKPDEIKKLRETCLLGRQALDLGHSMIKPGVTGDEIDSAIHQFCEDNECYPSPLNYHHFPKSCCVSVNEVICHGIPDCRPMVEGDIVNRDITVYKHGYHADLNETFLVGECDKASVKLLETAYACLWEAIHMCKPGVMYRDLGTVIQRTAGLAGFTVVRSYCGHGIGQLFHTAPNVPHYAKNKAVGVMKPGHVFTIEPMINAGSYKDKTWPDDWTAVTADGKRSAQFEHTLLITETGVDILTARLETSRPLNFNTSVDQPRGVEKK